MPKLAVSLSLGKKMNIMKQLSFLAPGKCTPLMVNCVASKIRIIKFRGYWTIALPVQSIFFALIKKIFLKHLVEIIFRYQKKYI